MSINKQIISFDLTLTAEQKTACRVIDYLEVGLKLKQLAKKFVFQLEEGQISKVKHFQIRLSAHKKVILNTFKKLCFQIFELLPEDEYTLNITPTSTNTHTTSNFNYVMKADTKIAGPWIESDFFNKQAPAYIPIRLRQQQNLRPFQLEIIKPYVNNDRMCNWIYDPVGCNGKSQIASLSEFLHNGIDLPPFKDATALMQVAYCEVAPTNLRTDFKIFIDIPRSVPAENLHEIITCVENLKKGKLYDPRNKYKKYWIEPPEIFVFSNHRPLMNIMSKNRWNMLTIDDKYEFVEYTNKDSKYEDDLKKFLDEQTKIFELNYKKENKHLKTTKIEIKKNEMTFLNPWDEININI